MQVTLADIDVTAHLGFFLQIGTSTLAPLEALIATHWDNWLTLL